MSLLAMFGLALLAAAAPVLVRQPQWVIGEIALFGQTGLDTTSLRGRLPVHPGDEVTLDHWVDTRAAISSAVTQAIGKAPTDVSLVSFDANGKSMIFIGLPGPTVRRVPKHSPPTANVVLPEGGAALYQALSDRLLDVTASGMREDDSKGYALFSDPTMHATQLKMRAYAVKHVTEIVDVLERGKSLRQRQSAAMLLGYARASAAQMRELASASLDVDETTRNNAVRALIVRVKSDAQAAALCPPQPFVDMMCSGVWTDRNKATWLVEALTRGRSPKLLRLIRERALPGLIEMVHWTDPDHAEPARLVLGRVAGIPERQLVEWVHESNVHAILSALRNSI